MGIKLDWELDAQRGVIERGGEDPDTKRQRRASQFRFFLTLVIFVLLGGGVVGVVALRLREVDQAIERQLRGSVEAEVTALRLGDETAYLRSQWQAEDDPSVTANWLARQEQNFAMYQALKQTRQVNLTGQVLDVAVDGQNGRVRVEEIIDGVPYGRMWFYWRFDNGWLHVPPAYGFWGDPHEISGDHFVVQYRDVDASVAQAIAAELPRWYTVTCQTFDCATLPRLTVEIAPDEALVAGWSLDDPWHLRLPSPYIERARLDQPFDPSLRLTTAALLAERLTGSIQTNENTDAAFFRAAAGDYLIEQFAQVDTASHLVTSLVESYGPDALRRLLSIMSPQATIGALTLAANQPLDALRVDWRDFLTWRLRTENELIRAGAETAFYALYDPTDSNTLALAAQRFGAGASDDPVEVTSALLERADDGRAFLRAQAVVDGGAQTEVLFRLVDGEWKRAS